MDIAIHSLALGDGEPADITIGYSRATEATDLSQIFLADRTIAVCSPQMMAVAGRDRSALALLDLPLLLDTADAWSWRRWCKATNVAFQPRGGSITLDTDEASIDACLSGLGIGQASPSFIERELRSGQLIALLPDIAPIVGSYVLAHPPASELAEGFLAWLETQNETAKVAVETIGSGAPA